MLALHIGKGFVPFLLALVLPGRRGCVGVGVGREVLANAHRDIDREADSLTPKGISTEKQLHPRIWRDIDREAGISSN